MLIANRGSLPTSAPYILKIMFNIFKKKKEFVTIVSGLPRSGTSMMMKMLEAGGLTPVTDNFRTADEDNPKGYYEFENVKKPDTYKDWLPKAPGKVVKIISMLLENLLPEYSYKIVFMLRNIDEILASQRQMLIRRGEQDNKVPDEQLSMMYKKHLTKMENWFAGQPNLDVLYVKYNEVLENPVKFSKLINSFLENKLDEKEMAKVIDKNLYRQRSS